MPINFLTRWRERRDVIRALDRLDRETHRVTQSRDDLERHLAWLRDQQRRPDAPASLEHSERAVRQHLFYIDTRLDELKQRRIAIRRDGRRVIPWWLR